MPLRIIYILIFILFISCNQKKATSYDFDNIKAIDTTCLKELKNAKQDVRDGRLVYCHYAGNMLYFPLRSEEQMRKLLRKYKIEYYNEMSSCIVFKDQTEGCYCEFMEQQIKKKFGEHFLDSLLNLSDSLYVFTNPLDTFHYSQCDTWPHFPGEKEDMEFSYLLQRKFDSIIKYPNDYIKKENRDITALVDVGFIVDKNGKATNVGFWFIFDHEKNKKHEEYLEKIIEPLILKTTWTPATIRKQKVISDMNVRIWLD